MIINVLKSNAGYLVLGVLTTFNVVVCAITLNMLDAQQPDGPAQCEPEQVEVKITKARAIEGGVGESCYGNGTCDGDLACDVDNLCVELSRSPKLAAEFHEPLSIDLIAPATPQNKLTNPQILRVMKDARQRFKACSYMDPAHAPARINVAFNVSPAGGVEDLEALGTRGTSSLLVRECVLSVMRTLTFPAAPERTQISKFPILL